MCFHWPCDRVKEQWTSFQEHHSWYWTIKSPEVETQCVARLSVATLKSTDKLHISEHTVDTTLFSIE